MSTYLTPTSKITPILIPGCVGWWDGLDPSTITLNGSDVSQWDDKSGLGNHVAQVTAAEQPEYTAATGKLTFDGSDDNLEISNADQEGLNFGSGDCTMIAACSTTATIGGDYVISKGDGSPRYGLLINNAASPTRWGIVLNDTSTTKEARVESTIINDGVIRRIIGRRDGNNLRCRIDDTDATPTDITSFGSTDGTIAFTMGGLGNGGWRFDGSIYEVIMYKRSLTDAEVLQIETYLINKWGVAL